MPGKELAMRARQLQWSPEALMPLTIYFGGGTPGILGQLGLEKLLDEVCETIDLIELLEWSMELTPTAATLELLQFLRSDGVNRISLGVQSFRDATLHKIGRRHTRNDIFKAVDALNKAGFDNFGLDLIAGLPGVTLSEWQNTIREALHLNPTHLSVYNLSIETGCQWYADFEAGRLKLPDDEMQMAVLDTAEEILCGAGFNRYEISNFARPGYECQHNLACWQGADYLGLGPSASSRIGISRFTNDSDLAAYMNCVKNGVLPSGEYETLSEVDDITERFVTGLRLNAGVSPDLFATIYKTPDSLVEKWKTTLRQLQRNGITEITCRSPETWCLTKRGRDVTDAAIEELL